MTTTLAITFGDYGVCMVTFVGVFLATPHLSRKRTRKRKVEDLDKQVKDLEHVSDILERMAESKKRGNDHGLRK
jgi:hypothetical protein